MRNGIKQEVDRKKDHIELAMASATQLGSIDSRFYYEPLLGLHPSDSESAQTKFMGTTYGAPIWISSMTGGTQKAKRINENLARACKEFQLGMGLGSCRKLLDSDEYLADFQVRKFIGDRPLFANLGIAQIIELINQGSVSKINVLLDKLEANGLIIHINPTQEWLQPEGDAIKGIQPIDAIRSVLDDINVPVIVKEVGQGMGPKSLKALMEMPLAAIEFAAYGGTNFAKLENLRDTRTDEIDPLCYVGHTPSEMIEYIHYILSKDEGKVRCQSFIISGGIKNYMDGYYYRSLLNAPSIYGQAAAFLKYADGDYTNLAYYVEQQIKGYTFAQQYLSVKS